MEEKQLYVLLVGIVMIASTIGFGLYRGGGVSPYAGAGPQEPQSFEDLESEAQPLAPPATPVSYEVENVTATVERLLTVVRLSANTQNAGMDEIRDELRTLPGVVRVEQAFFNQVEDPAQGIPVAAQLVMAPDYDPLALQDAFAGMNTLQNVSGFSRAMLKLPPSLELVNPDLNLVSSHELEQPFSEAVTQLSTQQGDELTVTVRLTLRGDTLESIEAFEVSNQSSSFTGRSMTATLPVASLENSILFTAPMPYTGQSVTPIEDVLKALPDANADAVLVNVDAPGPIRLSFEGDTDALMEDLNTFAAEHQQLPLILEKNPDGVVLEIAYGLPDTFNTALENTTQALTAAGFEEDRYALEPYTATLQGVGAFTTDPGDAHLESVKDILKDYVDIEEVEFQRVANFAISELRDKDANKTFVHEDETVQALMPLGTQVGEEIELVISFFTQRDTVLFATAGLASEAAEAEETGPIGIEIG